MIRKVIILNGEPRTGKDTIAITATSMGLNTVNHSTVAKVKQWATMMGWDGSKTSENRLMLSDLKDFYTKYFDGPFKDMTNLIMDRAGEPVLTDFIFLHIREPVEIARVVDFCHEYNIGVTTVLVTSTRNRAENDTAIIEGNTGDSSVSLYEYDYILANNGTIAEYEAGITDFLELF